MYCAVQCTTVYTVYAVPVMKCTVHVDDVCIFSATGGHAKGTVSWLSGEHASQVHVHMYIVHVHV